MARIPNDLNFVHNFSIVLNETREKQLSLVNLPYEGNQVALRIEFFPARRVTIPTRIDPRPVSFENLTLQP